ncbi:uncharacterized protein LOC135372188 [Ornithodoros turicata]|uniref:uncharacterized protein LOC135372188 n=1 Tax=Ornithodoros turicata TaxID=34597 RepID=UPI003139A713
MTYTRMLSPSSSPLKRRQRVPCPCSRCSRCSLFLRCVRNASDGRGTPVAETTTTTTMATRVEHRLQFHRRGHGDRPPSSPLRGIPSSPVGAHVEAVHRPLHRLPLWYLEIYSHCRTPMTRMLQEYLMSLSMGQVQMRFLWSVGLILRHVSAVKVCGMRADMNKTPQPQQARPPQKYLILKV